MAGTDVAYAPGSSAEDPGGPWRVELPARPERVAEGRRAVADHVRKLGAGEMTVADVALAVSEAATNAVMHAFVDVEPGTVCIAVEPLHGALRVVVVDDGTGMTPRPDSPGLGLGLPTIGQLTESFDVREGPGGRGTEVRMVFAAPDVRAPAPPEGDLLDEIVALTAAGWPRRGVDDLTRLLVPRLADVCSIDLVEHGGPRRIAARVDDDPTGELSAWLATRRPPDSAIPPLMDALRGGEVRVLALDDDLNRTLASSDEEFERMRSLDIAHWVNIPLVEGETLLGGIGLGMRASRPDPTEQRPFLRALGDTAAAGLANAHLVDELRRTRGRLERILGALSEAVTVNDADGRMVYANEAVARLLGCDSVDEVLATPGKELAARFAISREDGSPVAPADLPSMRVLAGGPAESLLTRSVRIDSGVTSWLLTKATLIDDEERLAVTIIEDVTEAKDAELRQRFLAEASAVLASTLDFERTLTHVARLAVPSLADWCAVDLLTEDGGLERVVLAHADPDKEAAGREIRRRYPPDLARDEGIGHVLRTGEPLLYRELTDEVIDAVAVDAEHARLLRELGMRSALVVALRAHERTLGVLSLVTTESGRTFGPGDVAFASELAVRFATAVENARSYRER